MKNFLTENFLLKSATAQHLYHNVASKCGIIDYHCHLDPRMVAEDVHFRTITELWLGGDHYKWRLMRANGVSEDYITGNADDWQKFEKWAETMPYAMRNPIYHWSHLELKTAFGIDQLLNPEHAKKIYDACNEMLQKPEFSARGLMRHYGVEVVCTTDDPIDSLEYHIQTRKSGFEIKMLPTWRPDKAMNTGNAPAYVSYLKQLQEVSGVEIKRFDNLLQALQKRHDFFAEQGCRLSDHGIDVFYADDYTPQQIEQIFSKLMSAQTLTQEEESMFKSAMLYELAKMDDASGWVQQFHFGPVRNNNSRLLKSIGADAGADSMNDLPTALSMAKFLDKLDGEGHLAKTIIYNLNPAANTMVATMIGNFQDGTVPGKMQWGAGWWFCDQKEGIEQQLNILSLQGLLSRFVGMLTDSRSFLSYPRHEYFRRILCNLIGEDVENGELPVEEMKRIEQMVQDICYNNAKKYFQF